MSTTRNRRAAREEVRGMLDSADYTELIAWGWERLLVPVVVLKWVKTVACSTLTRGEYFRDEMIQPSRAQFPLAAKLSDVGDNDPSREQSQYEYAQKL